MKEIILDVLNETGEVKIETKGFFGKNVLKNRSSLKKHWGRRLRET